MDAGGKDAEDAGGGEVLSGKLPEGSDSAGQIQIFFIFEVHVLS